MGDYVHPFMATGILAMMARTAMYVITISERLPKTSYWKLKAYPEANGANIEFKDMQA